jgi:hypothetical protein
LVSLSAAAGAFALDFDRDLEGAGVILNVVNNGDVLIG